MKYLAIDTSTKTLSLAISDGKKVLRQKNLILDQVLSNTIIPAIKAILSNAKLPLEDLDCFVVGLGPGSFTGLRVGLATMKGLAFATGKPIVGISSLDALAMNVADEKFPTVCTICDARRHLVYACFYRNTAGKLSRTSDYLLESVDEVIKRVQGPTIFVGDAVDLYQEVISEKCPQKVFFADKKHSFPRAKYLITFAAERFAKKKNGDNINSLVPLYVYPEDCQVTKKKP